MKFKRTAWSGEGAVSYFTELSPPEWLLADNAWFWKGHVLTLAVGETVETDFSIIERVE